LTFFFDSTYKYKAASLFIIYLFIYFLQCKEYINMWAKLVIFLFLLYYSKAQRACIITCIIHLLTGTSVSQHKSILCYFL